MNTPRVVIFANGDVPEYGRAARLLDAHDVIVCADGGTRHAVALGLSPQVIIGDMDSIPESGRPGLGSGDTRIIQHPRDKDETDLELALAHSLSYKPHEILVVGALGGRLDQTLGNLALLAGRSFQGIDVRLDDGTEAAFFCSSRREVQGAQGDLVSLLPWGGDADGVTTRGLRWPLHAETLYSNRTRGLSNELVAESAEVTLESGLLLVVHRRLT